MNSGQVITKTDITGQHQFVRDIINAVQAQHLGRGAFIHDQLPSLLYRFAHENILTQADVTIGFTTFTELNPAGVTWADLTGYSINNSGLGYALPEKTLLLAWANLRYSLYDCPTAGADNRHQGWLHLYPTIDGVPEFERSRNRPMFDQDWSGRLPGDAVISDAPLLMWGRRMEPCTLNALTIRASLNQGNGAFDAAPYMRIKNGSIGFIALRRA